MTSTAEPSSIAWQREYWERLSGQPGLRPVIDPAADDDAKNRRLDGLHREQLVRFVRDLGITRIGAVLDFGCGIGRHHELLASIAERYVGVDIADGMIRRAPGEVHLVDGTHLPFDEGTFDCVLSFWVLQHIVDDALLDATVAELRRCLAAGGHVIICERSSRRPSEAGRPEGYIRHRAPAAYVDLFRRHGLRLARVRKLVRRRRWRDRLRRVLREGENLYAFAT